MASRVGSLLGPRQVEGPLAPQKHMQSPLLFVPRQSARSASVNRFHLGSRQEMM